ncbi:MAG: geranylgeranyl reductase family protein [Vulcanisaeta sp. AZ3]
MGNIYDAIVVGAGPAGSMAAYTAARLGLRVLIIDRFRFPRIKPCGGGLTQKSVTLLHSVGIDVEPVIRDSCGRVVLVNNAGSFVITSDEPIISVVSRDEFDNYLLTKALDEGVDYVVDRVVAVHNDGDWVSVIGMNNTYVGKYVIAADGVNSVIAKGLGNNIRKGVAIAFMTIAHGEHLSDVCVLDMTRARWGYSWVFPRGGNEYDVGIGSLQWGDYRQRLIEYVNTLKMKMGAVLGHPIPIRHRDRIVIKRIALVGDAGGFADPTTGEGIFYAMYTGIAAALALGKSRASGEFAGNYLRLVRPLIRNLSLAYYISLGTYGIDNLVMGRLGVTAFSMIDTGNLIKKVMGVRFGILKQ